MKKILFIAVAAVAMVSCGSCEQQSNQENVAPGAVQHGIVHRVWHASFNSTVRMAVRMTSGVELEFSDSWAGSELSDLKYVQPGDTLYYYCKGECPVAVRVGFAN